MIKGANLTLFKKVNDYVESNTELSKINMIANVSRHFIIPIGNPNKRSAGTLTDIHDLKLQFKSYKEGYKDRLVDLS